MRIGAEVVSLVAVCSLAACVVEEDDTGVLLQHGVINNGQDLNGQDLNGQDLNGQDLNGQDLNGSELGSELVWVDLQHVKINGKHLHHVRLEGSEIVGMFGPNTVRGTDLLGATFRARSDTREKVAVRLAEVVPPDSGSDVWHYRVEYQETNDQWYPVCLKVSTMEHIPAVPLAGWWDRSQGTFGDGDKQPSDKVFTFACPRLGALGKCVDAGYRPWASATLDAHHQACTRMIRADYCGTSVSYTLEGKLINIYDNIGVQLDTEDWDHEAEWDTGGARCISSHVRLSVRPPCFVGLQRPSCGNPADWAGGTLLVSEVPPGGPIIIDP